MSKDNTCEPRPVSVGDARVLSHAERIAVLDSFRLAVAPVLHPAIDDIKRALTASAGVVPDGWRLVPVDLTRDMQRIPLVAETHEAIWNAFLAAAPTAPSAASQPGSTQEPPPGDRSTDISKLDPREQALERMAENARELGLDYDEWLIEQHSRQVSQWLMDAVKAQEAGNAG